MIYARVSNGSVIEYPITKQDIIKRHSNVSFPIPFEAPDDYEEVVATERPPISYDKNLIELTPSWIDGSLKQVWSVEDASGEEIAERTEHESAQMRLLRNNLLSQCDWTQLADSSADSQAWAAYRQALRDIPEQVGFPWEITWPTKP